MTAAMQTSSNIVQLRLSNGRLTSSLPTPLQQIEHWSESLRDEPSVTLPDLPAEIVEALPDAIEQARQAQAPGDAVEVLKALTTLCGRKGLPVPDDIAMEMDAELM